MNFRDKDTGRYVEAWQFDGSYASMADVIADHGEIYWQHGTIRVRTPDGNESVEPSGWVIHADDAFRTSTDEQFPAYYEEVE